MARSAEGALMRKPTADQERANFALDKVLHDPLVSKNREKFLIDLRHLPAQLHWGGLGQTAASLLADGEKPQRKRIYDWLEEWLRKKRIYSVAKGAPPSLIDAIAGSAGSE